MPPHIVHDEPFFIRVYPDRVRQCEAERDRERLHRRAALRRLLVRIY